MTLEDKILYFLQTEWEAGDETKREAVEKAELIFQNIWDTISQNPDEGHTVEGLIKNWFIIEVDAECNDQDLTDALETIIELEKGAA